MYSDLKYIVRFTCLAFALLNNIPILIIVVKKLFEHIDQINKTATLWSIAYIVFAILQPGYNLLYRFIITQNDCFWSDCIDEWLLVFSRIALVYSQTYRIQLTFKGSFLAINKTIMTWSRNLFLIFALVMNFLWIHVFPMYVSPKYHNIFGVYCSNGGNGYIVLSFYAVDGLFHIALIAVFVQQLNKIASNSDTNKINAAANQSIRRTGKMSAICIGISIVTTCTFVVASVLQTFPVPQLRWFFPLDFIINVWCLLLMFKNVHCCLAAGKFKSMISHRSLETKLVELHHHHHQSSVPKKHTLQSPSKPNSTENAVAVVTHSNAKLNSVSPSKSTSALPRTVTNIVCRKSVIIDVRSQSLIDIYSYDNPKSRFKF